MTPPETEPVLGETDIRAIVRVLSDVTASRRDHAGTKQLLMDGLCELIGGGAWVWTLGCAVEPGQQPIYVSMSHGGLDEQRYAALPCASAHPDMA